MFDFTIKDLIDILLVAFIFYQVYRLFRGTIALNIFVGILTFIAFWFLVTSVLDMQLLGSILDKVISLGGVLLIVVFQEEIRRFFFNIGIRRQWRIGRLIERLLGIKQTENTYYGQVLQACIRLSKTKTGALIVIERVVDLHHYSETGEEIKANISARLIENIFFKNSPLHDGAMIIARGKIMAVGCILPISHNQNMPKHLGLRHRSALGISEKSDAFTIVVSEETGSISVAENGELTQRISYEDLEKKLKKLDAK
ncbi:MAG: diadenylate cyclase CdaA [Prevotellaceae bacterium]|jgi:uncharacterized protein (TIGR00159 family)|nr:diadenylate cyclase CdaA [Prevotellaceae bacterium]